MAFGWSRGVSFSTRTRCFGRKHIPLRNERMDDLMRSFEQRYRLGGIGKVAQIIAMSLAG
jgi:hypothetical protein